MDPAFSIENVTKRYRRADGSKYTAIADLNLAFPPGESAAIIGPSGAGKTTLLRLLNLTLLPDTGEIRVDGINPVFLPGKELRKLRARTATIYQQHNLVASLRVIHNILAGNLGTWSFLRAVRSLFFPREVKQAAAAARKVGVLEKLWERTDRLSGGEQQRVAMARALIQNPRHLLADEPIASVDPSLSDSLIAMLRHMSDAEGKTLIVSLHDVPLALRHFPRIIGLHPEGLLFDLPPDAVTEDLLAKLYATEAAGADDARSWLRAAFENGR